MRALLLALLPAVLSSAPPAGPAFRAPTRITSDTLRLVVAPDGNEARYRVREQLAHHDLPNDAVGVTHAVTGTVVLDGRGRIVPGASNISVDVRPLQSDRSFRDRYVQGRILETDSFPTVAFAPATSTGFPATVPATGDFAFTVTGDLTVHATTRPTTWNVTARAVPGGYTGTATTRFTFEDFGLHKPNVPIVLSVADTITLEYDFHLVPAPR
jgi:polyisoprenoid-binding protein YceI